MSDQTPPPSLCRELGCVLAIPPPASVEHSLATLVLGYHAASIGLGHPPLRPKHEAQFRRGLAAMAPALNPLAVQEMIDEALALGLMEQSSVGPDGKVRYRISTKCEAQVLAKMKERGIDPADVKGMSLFEFMRRMGHGP